MLNNPKPESVGEQQFKSDLKIIVIGSAGTGKTSYIQKWIKNEFREAYQATIVSQFGFKVFERKGKLYRVQLWDIAGQERNLSITKVFAKAAHGYIVCADCMDKASLDDAIKWKKTVDDLERFPDGNNLSCILLENKGDLLPEGEMNNTEAIDEFGRTHGFNGTFRTSAKMGINVKESIEFLIEKILERMENYSMAKGQEVFKSDRQMVELDKKRYLKDPKPAHKTGVCC